MIRRNTDEEDWVYYNFSKDESNNSQPKIKLDQTLLQLAVQDFDEERFEDCGNKLRKEAEDILTRYLDPEMKQLNQDFELLSKKLEKSFNKITNKSFQKFNQTFLSNIKLNNLKKLKTDYHSDGLLSADEITELDRLKYQMFDFLVELNETKNRKELLITNTKEILDRVMNSASHHGENPLYRAELKDAIEKITELKKLLV